MVRSDASSREYQVPGHTGWHCLFFSSGAVRQLSTSKVIVKSFVPELFNQRYGSRGTGTKYLVKDAGLVCIDDIVDAELPLFNVETHFPENGNGTVAGNAGQG